VPSPNVSLRRNEAHQQPIISLQIARGLLLASDPRMGKRTAGLMDELVKLKHGRHASAIG